MDKKDNLALAYAVKRRGKKMASGGPVLAPEGVKSLASAFGNNKADGGFISTMKHDVLKKIKAKKMASGGKVDDDNEATSAFEYIDEDESQTYPDADYEESDKMDDFDPEDAKKQKIKKLIKSMGC